MEDTVLQETRSRRKRFAIFDFDWTLVKPRQGRRFPKSVEDWQYLLPSVPDTIHTFAKTHQIVIVTDQSKPWKIEQIRQVVADLDVTPMTVVIGVKTNKPDTALFRSVFPVVDKGFFVGDAAGRPGDWSDKDRVFAQNLGVPFFTPEEIFPYIGHR